MKKRFLIPFVILLLCFTTPVLAMDADLYDTYQASDKTPGWHTGVTGKKYYIKENGKRARGWKKIDGKFYYFTSKGALTNKTGWVTLNGKRYYIKKDHTRCEGGMYKIGKKKYYFNTGGALVTNRGSSLVNGKYYTFDDKGVATEVPSPLEQCKAEAQKFVKAHTSAGQTPAQKLRNCFDYLLAYMSYVPGTAPNTADKNWKYKEATEALQTMSGNCYSFACGLCACAKVIGYHPVLILTDGHAYVKINNGYFDNMYGGKFGVQNPVVPESQAYYKKYF